MCPVPAWLHCTINGLPLLIVNLSTPRIIRLMVFGFSGLTAIKPYFSLISSLLSKIDGQGSVQSMISAALRQGWSSPLLTAALSRGAWVGLGHTIGFPSHRATKKNRLRVVGAP